MTNEFLQKLLLTTDISKGRCIKQVGNIKAIFMKNISVEVPVNGRMDNIITVVYDYIVLVKDETIIIGGMLKMENKDVHILIFDEFRGKGYCSKIMKDNFLKRIWRDSEISCNTPDQYFKVRHLVESSGLRLVDINEPLYELSDDSYYKIVRFGDLYDINNDFYTKFINLLMSKNVQSELLRLSRGDNGTFILSKGNISYIISIDNIVLFKDDKNNTWNPVLINISLIKYGFNEYSVSFDISDESRLNTAIKSIGSWLSGKGFL